MIACSIAQYESVTSATTGSDLNEALHGLQTPDARMRVPYTCDMLSFADEHFLHVLLPAAPRSSFIDGHKRLACVLDTVSTICEALHIWHAGVWRAVACGF
jgi:hypothetical protein